MTVRHLKAYVQLEIPENCRMHAYESPSREIFVQLGRLPSENLLVFQNWQALQQLINAATSTETEQSGDTDDADTPNEVVSAPNWR